MEFRLRIIVVDIGVFGSWFFKSKRGVKRILESRYSDCNVVVWFSLNGVSFFFIFDK